MILVDTDIIIWNWRGRIEAAELLGASSPFALSVVSYMELVQGMRNQTEWSALAADLKQWHARLLPITEAISIRAVSLVEQHFRSHHLQMADALIAATALESGIPLATGNAKHFKAIDGLKLQPFKVK